MKTYAQLKQSIRDQIFVPNGGEAPNLVAAHNRMFLEAMTDIQRWVECFKKNNLRIQPFCSTFYKCGLTIIEKPENAIIKRIWVVDRVNPSTGKSDADFPIDWCTRVEYQQKSWCDIQQYNQVLSACGCTGQSISAISAIPASLCSKTIPKPTDEDWDHLPSLPLGHHYNQAATDASCRALRGVWALHRGRIYIGPWIQSTETIVIEYDGTKVEWDDDDIVSEHDDFENAVRNYVHFNHELDYGDEGLGRMLEGDYNHDIQQLLYDCEQENRVRECDSNSTTEGGSAAGEAQDDQYLRPTLEGQGTCDTIEAVTFDPPAGATVAFPTFVVLSSLTPNADIYFTTDGNAPTADSTKYTGPFQIDRDTVVRAIAIRDGCWSAVTSSQYEPYLSGEELDIYGPIQFWRYCAENFDRAGAWYVFESNGSSDTKWGLRLPSPKDQILDTMVLYRTQSDGTWNTGQVWATVLDIYPPERGGASFGSYPLVVDDADKLEQINFAYMEKDLVNPLSKGIHKFDLFGDVVLKSHDWYKLVLTFRDKEVYLIRDGKVCGEGDPLPCMPPTEDCYPPDSTTTTTTTSSTTTQPTTTTTTTTTTEAPPCPDPEYTRVYFTVNNSYGDNVVSHWVAARILLDDTTVEPPLVDVEFTFDENYDMTSVFNTCFQLPASYANVRYEIVANFHGERPGFPIDPEVSDGSVTFEGSGFPNGISFDACMTWPNGETDIIEC